MTDPTEIYEVPKEELPAGIKSRTIFGSRDPNRKPKFSEAPAHLKILPYLEWGNQAYKSPPKGLR